MSLFSLHSGFLPPGDALTMLQQMVLERLETLSDADAITTSRSVGIPLTDRIQSEAPVDVSLDELSRDPQNTDHGKKFLTPRRTLKGAANDDSVAGPTQPVVDDDRTANGVPMEQKVSEIDHLVSEHAGNEDGSVNTAWTSPVMAVIPEMIAEEEQTNETSLQLDR
jgi:hypothetical protein